MAGTGSDVVAGLARLVRQAGRVAARRQRELAFAERAMKADGSVVTEADREVEDLLCEGLSRLLPGANLVTEERARAFAPGRPFTVAVDPIDGTDSFSQGLPTWAISVGLLDAGLEPCAGVVHAPRLGLTLVADGERVLHNGRRVAPPGPVGELSALSGLVVSSRAHRGLDMHRFPGKVRGYGSAALNLAFPAVFAGTVATLQGPGSYVWDIAGAHAICRALGCAFEYLDGRPVDYAALRERGWKTDGGLIAARPGALPLVLGAVALLERRGLTRPASETA